MKREGKHGFTRLLTLVGAGLVAVSTTHVRAEDSGTPAAAGAPESESGFLSGFKARPTFSLTTDVVNQYVWRGMLQNADPVVQPSATITWNGFSLNVWGSIDPTHYGAETSDTPYADRQGEFEEVDYTLAYSHSFDAVKVGVGYICYTFPGSPWENTQEVFLSAALTKVPLTPTLAAYYDFDEAEGFYVNGSVSHSFTLVKDKLSLGLGAGLGWGDHNMNEFYYGVNQNAFSDASVSATLTWNVTSALTVSPYVRYSEIVDGALRDVRQDLPDSSSAHTVVGIQVGYSF
jgi:uncharacterized protein (TIGR02001 family)